MIAAVVIATLSLAAPPVRTARSILFLGNSHTFTNDVPGMVRSLLGGGVKTDALSGGFLDDIWLNRDSNGLLEGKWTDVVLQGAKLSSSHKYEYPNEGTIQLAKHALGAGSRVHFFVEWPRKGWNESDFQWSHYRKFASKAGGGDLIPICWAWDAAIEARRGLDLWSGDGNHAALPGSYLAACVIAYWLEGAEAKLTWRPSEVDPSLAAFLRQIARGTVLDYRKAKS